MGQESSAPVGDHVRPQTLKDRSVESIAKFIKSGRAKKIVVMVSQSFQGFSTSFTVPSN